MDDSIRQRRSAERLLQLRDVPIDDDAALLERVRSVIGEGRVRRLWLLLLDADGITGPRLAQIDGTPITPEAEAVVALRRLMAWIAGADWSVVVVLERPGPRRPSPDDWAWHDVIRRAADGRRGALRSVLLAHSGGVDELVPGSAAG